MSKPSQQGSGPQQEDQGAQDADRHHSATGPTGLYIGIQLITQVRLDETVAESIQIHTREQIT
jgi:hypothetical protein